MLREEGIPSAALLDVVRLGSGQRQRWEPRLAPYRGAVVVLRAHAARAQQKLAGRSGMMLVIADPRPARIPADGADVPVSADPRFDLAAFLAALAQRAGDDPADVDTAAGVIVVGEFSEPLTGRAARIAAARADQQQKADELANAKAKVTSARNTLSRARVRTEAAEASEEAATTEQTMAGLRAANVEREERRDQLKPLLDAAYAAYASALGTVQARKERIDNLRGARQRLDKELSETETSKTKLIDERLALDLPSREAAWGDSPQAAERFLLSLNAEQQERSTGTWNEEACYQADEVARRCFPPGTPHDEMPAEIRELLIEQRWQRGGLETRIRLMPALLRALRTHLTQTEQHDLYQQRQITAQRTSGPRPGGGPAGTGEAEQTSRAHRASLAQGIKAKLKKVSDEFDRLDQNYGGYGAGLDYPEPESARRARPAVAVEGDAQMAAGRGKTYVEYNLRGNTAQIDEKAVKLVCAAALAGGGSGPCCSSSTNSAATSASSTAGKPSRCSNRSAPTATSPSSAPCKTTWSVTRSKPPGLYIKLRRSSDASPTTRHPSSSATTPTTPRRTAPRLAGLLPARRQLHR